MVLLLRSSPSHTTQPHLGRVECRVFNTCLYTENHRMQAGYFILFSFCLFHISFNLFSLNYQWYDPGNCLEFTLSTSRCKMAAKSHNSEFNYKDHLIAPDE